jgi:hypothetical protein
MLRLHTVMMLLWDNTYMGVEGNETESRNIGRYENDRLATSLSGIESL